MTSTLINKFADAIMRYAHHFSFLHVYFMLHSSRVGKNCNIFEKSKISSVFYISDICPTSAINDIQVLK